jgi:hypothetical protein
MFGCDCGQERETEEEMDTHILEDHADEVGWKDELVGWWDTKVWED